MKQTAQTGIAPSRMPIPSKVLCTSDGIENSKAVPMELDAVMSDITP